VKAGSFEGNRKKERERNEGRRKKGEKVIYISPLTRRKQERPPRRRNAWSLHD
jgi:hypothetical protein